LAFPLPKRQTLLRRHRGRRALKADEGEVARSVSVRWEEGTRRGLFKFRKGKRRKKERDNTRPRIKAK
jgi:hypothetical protein